MTPQLERLGRDTIAERDLFLLSLNSSEELVTLSVPSKFVCLIAWDAHDVSTDEIGRVTELLLDAGAVYVCAWGSDCDRVHDIIDELIAYAGATGRDVPFVMTTWHSNQPLAEAIDFALTCAVPGDEHLSACRSTLGIANGSSEWASEIRAAFSG